MAKILLAEDDESMRHFLTRALERAGHVVFAVGRGDEALPIIAEGRFDLLLADIVMPKWTVSSWRGARCSIDPRVKVMFITGFAAVAMRQRTGPTAQAKVLSKPFHLRDLVGEIDRLLAAA